MFDSRKIDWCDYHEHNGEKERKACQAQKKLEGRVGSYENMDEENSSAGDDEEMEEET